MPELFAGTPPLEAMRIICSEAAKGGPSEKVVMVNDVRRAYFYAKALRPIWVELPEEDYSKKDEEEDNVGLLEMSLYGTRDAAKNWSNTVEEHLKKIGFEQGRASGNIYHNRARGLSTLVHGDDYVSVDSEASAMWLKGELEKVFDIKTSVFGRRHGLKKEVRVLNRVVRWTHEGWEYEADQTR